MDLIPGSIPQLPKEAATSTAVGARTPSCSFGSFALPLQRLAKYSDRFKTMKETKTAKRGKRVKTCRRVEKRRQKDSGFGMRTSLKKHGWDTEIEVLQSDVPKAPPPCLAILFAA